MNVAHRRHNRGVSHQLFNLHNVNAGIRPASTERVAQVVKCEVVMPVLASFALLLNQNDSNKPNQEHFSVFIRIPTPLVSIFEAFLLIRACYIAKGRVTTRLFTI